MPHPFASSHALVQNAKERAEDLIDLLIALGPDLEQYARRIVEERRDAPLPYAYYGVEFIKDVPDRIRIATRDVLHDLRAALDHMAFACARNVDAKSAFFPFSKTKNDLVGVVKRRCRDLPDEIVEIMVANRPYGDDDGDKLLYALNDMRNFNDHRLLQPMAQLVHLVKINTSTTLNFTPDMLDNPERWQNLMIDPQIFFPPMSVPEEKKVFFLRFDTRITKEPEVQFGIYVGFGDVGHFNNAAPIYVFHQLIPMVEKIIAEVSRYCAEREFFQRWRLRSDHYVDPIKAAMDAAGS